VVQAVLRPIPRERVSPAVKLLLIGEILIVYAVIRLRMRRRDVRELVAEIRARAAPSPSGLESGSLEARLVAARLGNAARRTLQALPTDSRCLVQSLVLLRLLAARGIASKLVIGACSSPQFEAHAWVEHEGQPVLPSGRFQESKLLEL